MKTRLAACSNHFYPSDPRMLKQTVLQHLSSVKFNARTYANSRAIKGIIVPHGGYMQSGAVMAYGYKLFGLLPKDREWKILIIGPSHGIPFSGAAVTSDSSWKMPLGDVRAKDLREEIGVKEDDEEIFICAPEIHRDEHSIESQIPFLQVVLDSKFIIYPLITGSCRPDILADKIADFLKKDDSLIVVSSNFINSQENEKTMNDIENLNLDNVIEKADASGRTGILTMMFLTEKLGLKPVSLSYQKASDSSNADTGYGSIAFFA